MPPSERTNKQQIINALNSQFIMTKNNQKTYERPELQVLFVETESVMATNSTGLQNFDSDNTDDDTEFWN